MVPTKVFTTTDLLSYVAILTNVSEEWGGTKTAYYYDLLARQEMAKALEGGEKNLSTFFKKVDSDLCKQARTKVDIKLQEQGRDATRGQASKGADPKGKGKSQDRFQDNGRGWGARSCDQQFRRNRFRSRRREQDRGGKGGQRDRQPDRDGGRSRPHLRR